jgi:hypothetical protein
VVLVGDRAMIMQTRIDEDIAPAGLDWIAALRAPAKARRQQRILLPARSNSGVMCCRLLNRTTRA